MSVQITFYAVLPSGIGLVNLTQSIPSSGLGFFGSGGFNSSVPVGSYQGTTYVTNQGGSLSGAKLNNITYSGVALSGIVQSGASNVNCNLLAIPNNFATLNISLTSSSGAVGVRNVQLFVYNNSDPTQAPSGVTTQIVELCNPGGTLGSGTPGLGSNQWVYPTANVAYQLSNSPGVSGISGNNPAGDGGANPANTALQHDWYVGISASPSNIGSKSAYGLYVSLEYL